MICAAPAAAAASSQPVTSVWRVSFPGLRMEAAAAPSACGRAVALGGEDGRLRLLRLRDGTVLAAELLGKGGSLKAPPVSDPWSDMGCLWLASHGREAFAVALVWGEGGEQPALRLDTLWRAELPGAAANAASFDAARRRVFFATLDGSLSAFSLRPGGAADCDPQSRHLPLAALAWCVSTTAPSFGSPTLLQTCGSLAVACADGRLRCFSDSGAPLRTLACGAAGGALFCTPTPLGASQLLVGTGCGRLLAVDCEGGAGGGRMAWELPLGCGRIVASIGVDASPPPPQWAGWRMVLVAAANPGEAILVAAPEGKAAGSVPRVLARLPFCADLFSAPVLCGGRAVLGCRDDHVYALETLWPAQGPSAGAHGPNS